MIIDGLRVSHTPFIESYVVLAMVEKVSGPSIIDHGATGKEEASKNLE